MILNSFEFCRKICPKKVEAAPKIIKTKENPNVNKITGNKLIVFFSTNSLIEFPEIYEI